jgi:hypothetical protein
MARYKVGDTIVVHGKRGTVVWVRENPSEIEAMDEYIVEFENKQRRFFIASELEAPRPLYA